MKKECLVGCLVTIIPAFCISTIALAEETSVSKASSQVVVTFSEDENPTAPNDPRKPGTSLDPLDPNYPKEEGEITGNNGPLSLDVVPSFNFGSQKISLAEMEYRDQSNKDIQKYIQVSDRRSEASGWTVKAISTDFIKEEDQSVSLKGAVITLPKGMARNALHDNPDAEVADGSLFVQGEGTELAAGEETTVFSTRSEGAGKLVSTDAWNANATTLTIPEMTAKTGTFTSTINWSLTTEVAP